MNEAICVENLVKTYDDGAGIRTPVLKGVSFSVATGEIVAVIGASGSGKSTLLHALGGLDSVDSGTITIAGKTLSKLTEAERDILRNHHLGFVYQFHHLLPEFTALENVAMPLFIRRLPKSIAVTCAERALTDIGLKDRMHFLPSQLSGGERQRVAIARAVVGEPDCILADEPTGNLDEDTAAGVFEGFLRLARERSTAIVIVTHDKTIAKRCDRIIRLENGRIVPVTD
ncbi:MAG: ABC transporter ATP-binding protein [Sutterella sp.]|nr:ABC transporter ATP-binding protein [Sutterella sp.]